MLHVIADQKYAPIFRDWIAERLPYWHDDGTTKYIASVLEVDGKVETVGVSALGRWTKTACEANAASDGSKRQKIDRQYIWSVFDYAFNVEGKNCMTTRVATDNHKSLALQELLGFKKVGVIEGYYGEGKDAVLFAITKQQWQDGKWGSLEAQGDSE